MKYVLKIKQLNQKQMNNYGIDIIKLLYNFKFISKSEEEELLINDAP